MNTDSDISPSVHHRVPHSAAPAYDGGDTEKGSIGGGGASEKYLGEGEDSARVRDADEESHSGSDGHVQRTLKARHLAMIALGGTIGTGLFVGSGSALARGGPVGTLLAYTIMGVVVYSVMVALGEMATLFPDSGGFTHFATRFVDPSFGFATGWNYWFSYAVTIPVELVAVGIVCQYWNASVSVAAFITPFFVAILAVNFIGVKAFGELEFWFSAIKIVAIVGLIILGIAIDCGAGPENSGYIGFRYWKSPGPFAQFAAGDIIVSGAWGRFLAFWNVFVQAAFSYLGTEILATTIGEAENPRKNVPKAISRVFYRILMFYVVSIFVIGLIVRYDDDRLLNSTDGSVVSSSPFVIAIDRAGIKGLPSVINAVLLIAAWSAGNSDLYASSRTLYSLALEGKAPKIFRKCTSRGLPIWCVAVTSLFGFLAYITLGGTTANAVFNWLVNVSSISGLLTWWVILLSYLRFYYGMRTQNMSRDDLPYKAPFQPYASWFGLLFVTLVVLFNGFPVFMKGNFTASGFFAAYINVAIFFGCIVGWKLFGGRRNPDKKSFFSMSTWVTLDAMDFTSGRRELDEMDARETERVKPKQKGWKGLVEKIFDWMF